MIPLNERLKTRQENKKKYGSAPLTKNDPYRAVHDHTSPANRCHACYMDKLQKRLGL